MPDGGSGAPSASPASPTASPPGSLHASPRASAAAAHGYIAGLQLRPADPWPASAIWASLGLEVGGVTASSLAERHGTPLLVIDEGEVRARARAAAALFPRALYAVKAFTSHAMIRLALDEGLDLVCATGGEVEACLRAGASASRIVLHGSNKSDAELDLAVRSGVSLVVVDGASELTRLDRTARERDIVQPILLRVVPEIEVETHEAIATGHGSSKFGTPIGDVVSTLRSAAAMSWLRIEGLHAHVGSQVLDAEPYRLALRVLLDLAARIRDEAGVTVRLLDIGGGFGVTYTNERALPMPEVAAALDGELESGARRHGLDVPTLLVEPGRSLVANAGITLYRVGGIKEAGGRTLVAVDGGMADNIRPMLYDARHAVALASPPRGDLGRENGAAPRAADPPELVPRTVVGRHCESGDVLAQDVELPGDLAEGDLLAFAATGAYAYSLSSNYNRAGRPAVVAVCDGASSSWLRREDAGDLDRLEAAASSTMPAAEPPQGVVGRAARARDARSFLTFWRAIVEEGRYVRSERVSHPLRVYRRRFRHAWTEHEAQIVAVAGDRVIGHVYVQRERHPVTRHVATLGIAVAAGFRGKGVGSSLLAEAIRWARAVDVEKIVLSVYPHNTAAIALYRRFGFVDEGRLARHSRKSYGYEDEILMAVWIGGDGQR